MRRILPVLFGCVLLALPVFAQRGGRGGGGGAMRGGSGGFHASASGGGFRGGGGFQGGNGFRGGGFRGTTGGFRGGGGYRGGGFRGGYGGRYYGYRGSPAFYYPAFYYGGYYDPFWWDSSYGSNYGYGYTDPAAYPSYAPSYAPANPSVVVISNDAPAPQPAVVVQQPAAPQTWESAPASQAQAKKYEEPLFLVATKDGTIRAVLAYWVEGMTVHYVTLEHQQKQTPLASVDRDLSERLNRERNVTFRLPG